MSWVAFDKYADYQFEFVSKYQKKFFVGFQAVIELVRKMNGEQM